MPQGGRRLIVVSNRGPVSYVRENGERVARRGSGGLVTALGGLVDDTIRDGSSYRMRFVVHEADAYDRYYNVISNPVLWFVQHYLWDLSVMPSVDRGFESAWDDGYAVVNATFADAVVEELDANPGATVFFQDYHLYLAPRYVRDERPDATLAHFIHIPWPDSDSPSGCGSRSTTVCSPTTWSASTPTAGGGTSSARPRISSATPFATSW